MGDQLTPDELRQMGFRHCGTGVQIDRSVRWFGAERVTIGDHVRIDCFSMISAGADGITIGNHVHIASGCYLYGGGGGIVLGECSGLSARVTLYTASDDFVDGWMAHPTVPAKYRQVQTGPVTVGPQVIVGCGAVVLPGVELAFGSVVGALSLVKHSTRECEIVAGVVAKPTGKLRDRQRLQSLFDEFLRESAGSSE